MFNQHLKDGMIKTCVLMLHSESYTTPLYYDLYLSLTQMIIKLQQNVGALAHDVYVSYLMLPRPIYRKEVAIDE